MRRFETLVFTTLLAITSASAHAAELINPLDPSGTGDVTITTVIGRIIQALFGVTGAVALLMFVYGGFLWLISGGEPDKVKKGKEVMIWSALGMAVMVGAYAIVKAIVSALESGTLG